VDVVKSMWIASLIVTVIPAALSDGAHAQVVERRSRPPIAFTFFYCDGIGDAYCEAETNAFAVKTPDLQTAGPDDSSPTWSPDAARIAFVREGDIVVMNATGEALIRLTNTAWREAGPSWSPDGHRIAFTSDRDGPVGLYVMNTDGSQVTRISTSTRLRWSRPSWSPDGQSVAVDCEVDPGNPDICLVRLSTGEMQRVTDDPASDSSPDWSPDGRELVFASYRWGGWSQIAVSNFDGTGVTSIGTGLDSTAPVWSPDGKRIAFTAWEGRNFAVFDIGRYEGELRWLGGFGVAPAWIPLLPLARFSLRCVGLTCTVDASDSLGDISAYVWSFGDGATGTGVVTTHTFSDAGDHEIRLTAFGANGRVSEERQAFYLNQPPTAAFTVSCEALTCLFDLSGTQDPDGRFYLTWDFGDGTSTWSWADFSRLLAQHIYPGPGHYIATLRVTDEHGGVAVATREIDLPVPKMHIGDIDVVISSDPRYASATFTVTVLDSGSRPVRGATVKAWLVSGPAVSCTTGENGTCQFVRTGITKPTISLRITDVVHPLFVYDATANRDPDGDSNGTTLTVRR
jgi:dipeptidyl aminopeptidase/acylaminoacyl peptidase